jgi:hypothetical protein
MRRSVPGWRKKYELPVMIVAIQPIQSYISAPGVVRALSADADFPDDNVVRVASYPFFT